MKITVALALIASTPLCLAKLEFGQFGGCLNRTAIGTDNANKAFHCHFDSTFCLDGEEWLTTDEVASEGFGPCTCDDDYNSNVFSHGCYDMQNTHAVECSATVDQCPEGWYDLGSRFNSGHSVEENCGHGDSAYADDKGGGKTESCGKRCTCNFQYQSRDTTITIGSTQYGMCFDAAADSKYCALKPEHCASSEDFYEPHSGAMSGTNCNCDDVHLGACMDGSSFSHCAVDIDNCKSGQTHLAPRALRETVPDADCRLCRNSWDENPPVAAPRSVPVAAPVTAPVSAPVKSPVATPVRTPVAAPVQSFNTDKSTDDAGTDDDDKKNDDGKTDDDDNSSTVSSQSSLLAGIVVVCLFLS